MPTSLSAIGLMSGTSMDGIDVAHIISDGETVRRGAAATFPYAADFRAKLAALIAGTGDRDAVSTELTQSHIHAVLAFLRSNHMTAHDIDVVGFHGHTIAHNPAAGQTVQIGDGAALATRVGIDVVDQFRTADVAAGGEGAPLAPLYHAALATELSRPVAVLNLGGVGNVTWIGASDTGDLLAFDTGPGNALLDDWVFEHTGAVMDVGGLLAAAGQADEKRVADFLNHPYFARRPPKSLDRGDFNLSAVAGLRVENGAATLVAMTVGAVVASLSYFPSPPTRWLVTGGGRHNPVMMAELQSRLDVPVDPVEAVGWSGDALEAQAFAFLAVRSLRGLPLSIPTTTGVKEPLSGGTLHRSN